MCRGGRDKLGEKFRLVKVYEPFSPTIKDNFRILECIEYKRSCHSLVVVLYDGYIRIQEVQGPESSWLCVG